MGVSTFRVRAMGAFHFLSVTLSHGQMCMMPLWYQHFPCITESSWFCVVKMKTLVLKQQTRGIVFRRGKTQEGPFRTLRQSQMEPYKKLAYHGFSCYWPQPGSFLISGAALMLLILFWDGTSSNFYSNSPSITLSQNSYCSCSEVLIKNTQRELQLGAIV